MNESVTYCKGAERFILPFSGTELPTNGIGMAYEPFEDSASQPIDFLHIAPLLWTEAHNLPGLQPTVIEQIGQAPLTWTSQHGLDDLPDLAAIGPVFHVGLARLS